ncbi:GntR family transcriptional regulator, partial [Xylella fastidiosa subsp. multiplex]|nr:GntR family transcriptional regulator [Xylella fastidiosa subsp. multiplex]
MTSVPLPIPSRTQYVLDAIKHRILTGQLTPGQALVETDLAAQ